MKYIFKVIEIIFGKGTVYNLQKRRPLDPLSKNIKGFGIDKQKLRKDSDNASPLHRDLNPWK